MACAVCVRGCPEDALALRAEGWQPGVGESGGGATGVTRLEFRPRRCSGCGACTALCDVDALTITGAGSWADLLRDDIVALARIPTRDCERCGAAFVPAPNHATLCAVCSFRRRNPFASAIPPEALASLPPDVAGSRGVSPPGGLSE